MKRADLDALEAIFAYDQGAVDSGVHDEVQRAHLFREAAATPEDTLRRELSEWVAERYLSEEALAQGYGWEDALEFLTWFKEGCGRQ